MIKCNVTVCGTISRSAQMRTNKDSKAFLAFGVSVVIPAKSGINKTFEISVAKDGKVFMSIENANDLVSVVDAMTSRFGVTLNGAQREALKKHSMLGVSVEKLPAYLSLPEDQMTDAIQKEGIPTDSIDNGDGKKGMSEFQLWVAEAVLVNEDMKIAIKADSDTPYKTVKTVMSELQDMNENRYYLITSLKSNSED